MCTFKCCGMFCSGFSIFCGIVLIVTGIFLWFETHSIYVPIEEGETSPNYHRAAVNCFVGAAIYAVVLALSIGCICIGRFRAKKEGNETTPNNSRPLTSTTTGVVDSSI